MERIEIKSGTANRIAFVHILPHSNLVKAILQAFQQTGFNAALITNGIGSLESVHYTFITKSGKYHAPILKKENCELLNVSGFIAKNTDKEVQYHIHATMSDGTGHTFGGHLLEEGNAVCATVELTLVEMKDIRIEKEYDEETGFTLFKVKH